eukprot:Clim_evm36s99 gene=Clim_evmTU36s99
MSRKQIATSGMYFETPITAKGKGKDVTPSTVDSGVAGISPASVSRRQKIEIATPDSGFGGRHFLRVPSSQWDTLPAEILDTIIRQLVDLCQESDATLARCLAQCSAVNRHWRAVFGESELWETLSRRQSTANAALPRSVGKSVQGFSWRTIFSRQANMLKQQIVDQQHSELVEQKMVEATRRLQTLQIEGERTDPRGAVQGALRPRQEAYSPRTVRAPAISKADVENIVPDTEGTVAVDLNSSMQSDIENIDLAVTTARPSVLAEGLEEHWARTDAADFSTTRDVMAHGRSALGELPPERFSLQMVPSKLMGNNSLGLEDDEDERTLAVSRQLLPTKQQTPSGKLPCPGCNSPTLNRGTVLSPLTGLCTRHCKACDRDYCVACHKLVDKTNDGSSAYGHRHHPYGYPRRASWDAHQGCRQGTPRLVGRVKRPRVEAESETVESLSWTISPTKIIDKKDTPLRSSLGSSDGQDDIRRMALTNLANAQSTPTAAVTGVEDVATPIESVKPVHRRYPRISRKAKQEATQRNLKRL